MKLVPVHAYVDSDRLDYPQLNATIRPMRELTLGSYPGLCVDVQQNGRHLPICIELGVDSLLPIIEEAARMWYDDNDMDPPEYLAEPPAPEGTGVDFCWGVQEAEACRCDECQEFLAAHTCEPDCD